MKASITWQKDFTEDEIKEIDFSLRYIIDHELQETLSEMDKHVYRMTVAKMAIMLNELAPEGWPE